jgi:hypothetical protein
MTEKKKEKDRQTDRETYPPSFCLPSNITQQGRFNAEVGLTYYAVISFSRCTCTG